MAKEKSKGMSMATERTYNIPLRRAWIKVQRYRRSKKAVTAVKEFLQKHMKAEEVKLGKHLNNALWERGMRNPPHHVKVNVKKDDEGKVFAEMVGAPTEEKKVEEKAKKEVPKPAEEVKAEGEKTQVGEKPAAEGKGEEGKLLEEKAGPVKKEAGKKEPEAKKSVAKKVAGKKPAARPKEVKKVVPKKEGKK